METIRLYELKDASGWVKLLNLHREQPITVQSYEAREAARNAQDIPLRLVAEARGRLVAIAQLSPSVYVPPGVYRLDMMVEPKYRRNGIGKRLLQELEQRFSPLGVEGVYCEIQSCNTGLVSWVTSQGFSVAVRRRESILTLNPAAAEPEHNHVTQPRIGTATDLLAMSHAPERWPELLQFLRQRLAETPDLADVPDWPEEQLTGIFKDSPNAPHDWVVVAEQDNTFVGTAAMHLIGSNCYLYFVGVHPACRNQGVGEMLIRHLADKAQVAGFGSIKVDNREDNGPALKLIEKLGFKPYATRLELRKTLSPRDKP